MGSISTGAIYSNRCRRCRVDCVKRHGGRCKVGRTNVKERGWWEMRVEIEVLVCVCRGHSPAYLTYRILGRACGREDLFFVLHQINLLYRLLNRTFTAASLRFIYPAFRACQIKRPSSFFRCSPFIKVKVLDLQPCLIPSISRLSLLLRLPLALCLTSSMPSFKVCLKTSRLQDLVTTHLITSHAATALRVSHSMSFQACYLLSALLTTTVRAQTTTA